MEIDYKKFLNDLRTTKVRQNSYFGTEESCCAMGLLYYTQFKDKVCITCTGAFRIFLVDENHLVSNKDFDKILSWNDDYKYSFAEIAEKLELEPWEGY